MKKGQLKKQNKSSSKEPMQVTHTNLHERHIKDSTGTEMVVISLRLDEYERLKDCLNNIQTDTMEKNKTTSFKDLRGLALKVPENPDSEFKTEDDLWKDDL